MMEDQDLRFLPFFLTEPIYLVPEPEPFYTLPFEEAQAEDTQETQFLETMLSDANSLEPVEEKPIEPQKTKAPLLPPDFEGENHKQILLLYHAEGSMATEERTLLEKILKAVNLSWNDVALCNWARIQEGMCEGINLITARSILVFGKLPQTWSLQHLFQKYNITQDSSGKQLLHVDELSQIAHSKDLKLKLWEGLQRMFQIKQG